MKRLLLLTLILFAVLPVVYAATGCCGNPNVANYDDNFCNNMIEQSVCCANLTTTQCAYFFLEGNSCTSDKGNALCQAEGCLICKDNNVNIGIFGTKANAYASCLLGTGRINPSIIYFNTSIKTQSQCENYASTYVPSYGTILISSLNLSPANPSKIITISGGKETKTITGSGANIEINALAGDYTITITAEGYDTVTRKGTLAANAVADLGAITLTSTTTGSLSGIVKSGTTPVRAMVVVNPGPNNYTTYSDTNTGFYNFPEIAPGPIKVLAMKDALSAFEQVTITAGTTTTLDLNLLPGGIVTGTVKDGTTDQVLQNIKVEILNKENKTNSVGYFVIKGILETQAGQLWTAYFSDPTNVYNPAQRTFNISSGQLLDLGTILLYRKEAVIPTGALNVEITLKDNLGNLIPLTTIRFLSGNLPVINGITDENGKVTLSLNVPATYRVIVQKDGYYYYDKPLAINETTASITIILEKQPIYTISGRVKDTNNNNIAGATITVGSLTTTTNYDGTFSISVPAGQRTVVATKAGYSQGLYTIQNLLSNINIGTIYLEPSSCEMLSDLSSPVITDIRQINDQVVVSFRNTCPADRFYIRQCEGNGCNPLTAPIDRELSDSPYTQSSIKGATAYCYVVQAHYSTLNTIKNSTSVCYTTGPQECLDNTGRFCYNGNAAECSNNNITIVDNCTMQDKFCSGGRCIYPSACDLCSRPFGIFSIPTQSIKERAGALTNTLCNALNYCYKDFTYTSADKYDECLNVDSCYYYKSKAACENDQNKCKKGPCEWIPSKYEELGQGVCRPVDEKKQDCRRCSEEFNQVYGACTKQTCELYGNCYFRPSTKECLNKADVSCDIYETEEDCTNGKPVIVNVTWFGTSYKFLGNNEILQRSNDSVSLGLCKWNATNENLNVSCFKDADESNMPDCDTDALHDSTCNLDFEPPVTQIEYADLTNEINFAYTVKDNKYDEDDVKTYYCVAKQNEYCNYLFQDNYPTTPANGRIIEQLEDDGIYNVYYFSEDPSKNLEQVKNITVQIDKTPPEIEPKVLKYVEVRNNQLVLDLAVELNLLSDNNEPVFCSGSLLNSPITSTNYSDSNTALTKWTYSYLGFTHSNAGTYTFRYSCKDAAGNIVQDDLSINIDPDMTIHSPTQATFNHSTNIPISVKTADPASCEYFDGSMYRPLTADEARTTHSTTVNVLTFNTAYQEYNVRCTLDSTGIVVQGTPDADTIKVAVDVQAPETRTYRYDEPYEIRFGDVWINNENAIKLECYDPEIPGRTQLPKEFGCSATSVYYCNTTNCEPEQKTNPYRPKIDGSTQICYYSVDNGGNKGAKTCANIKVDKSPPGINNSKILNLNLEEITESTKERFVEVRGSVINNADGISISSPVEAVYLELNNVRQNLSASGTNPINFISETPIILNPNSENIIKVIAVDKAGNEGKEIRKVIQDSEGPVVSNIVMISDIPAWSASGNNIVEYKYNSTIKLEAQDNVTASGIDPIERVSSVWIEDIYGKIIALERNNANRKEWSGRLETGKWPFGINKIKIYSNDTLGNVKAIDYNIRIIDTVPPTGNLKIETPEGFAVGIDRPVPAGINYVILNASESLSNIPIFRFRIGDYLGNVTLVARTVQGDSWLATFNVPAGRSGIGTFEILMNDSNGVTGNYVSGTNQFIVNSILPNLPDIPQYTKQYIYSIALSSAAKYTIKVNDEVVANNKAFSAAETSIKLKPGENQIFIRAADDNGNVNNRTYSVFYDDAAPIVIDNIAGAQKSSNVYAVVYEKGSGLANNTKMTILNKTTNTIIGTVSFTKSGDNYRFETVLPEGKYKAEISGSDNAENEINFAWDIEINPNANRPASPISGNVLGNRIFTKTATGLTDLYGQPVVKLTQNGLDYYYYVVVDNEAPAITLENKQYTHPGASYVIDAIVNNEKYPLDGITIVDNTNLGVASSTEKMYRFIWNVPNKEGSFNIATKLTDRAGNEGTATSSVIIDKIEPNVSTAEVSLVNVELINGTYLTRNNTIKFKGTIKSTDLDRIYVERNGMQYDDNSSLRSVSQEETEFEVDVTLLGTSMAETINNLALTFVDRAGNKKSIPFTIIKDLKPPELIELRVER